MNLPFIVFGAPDIQDAEIQEVVATMQSGWLGNGPKVAAFEAQFASFKALRVSQVAALNSCTASLHLSLLAAGVGPGDEVITTPLTFCATVNAILHTGATPVLADVDPQTMNIDPAQIESKITSKTKVILPVHFAGRPCEMDAICDLAAQHKLQIIEDCAHAVEASYWGRPTGTMGDFGCFSFYPTKNVTSGEGGMVIARDPERVQFIKMMSSHGISIDAFKRFSKQTFKHYEVLASGFKYNMMDLQAAIAIHQLKRVESAWERRCTIWSRYQQAFKDFPLGLPAPSPHHVRHAYHLYTLLLNEQAIDVSRDQFLLSMTKQGVGVGIHYPALPEHSFYQGKLGWKPENTPHATRIGRQTVSLPISPKLTDEEVQRVITAVAYALTKPHP